MERLLKYIHSLAEFSNESWESLQPVFEDEIATNISSFGSGQKSEYNNIACEPVTAILFDKEKLMQAAKESNEIETLGRNCIRLFATKQEEFSSRRHREG